MKTRRLTWLPAAVVGGGGHPRPGARGTATATAGGSVTLTFCVTGLTPASLSYAGNGDV